MGAEPSLAGVALIPQSKYVHELRAALPAEVFEPATSRLFLVPVYAAIAITTCIAIAQAWLPWFLWPLASLVIGCSSACLTFIAHEALHGGITRNKPLRYAVGCVGFLQYAVSPRLWITWHDRVHHSCANFDRDPDCYPTLAQYEGDALIRFATDMSLGGRRWRGVLTVITGFTVQSTIQLVLARTLLEMPRRAHRIAIAETVLGIAFWTVVATLVGFVPFLFIFVVPLLVANTIIMSFILTNHSLSPQVEVNDPLITGLSVTTSPWIERLTLGFGYHVEHHLFPAMSTRHAPRVRDLVLARWPERYQSMPLLRALGELHRTARVYKDSTTLFDPRTGAEFKTLLPRTAER
ncbi:MAG TPA: fatty acid desaturase [Kofleriaceae bacterium]